jgi:hypothetical protein
MMTKKTDFRTAFAALTGANVQFVIIGGVALTLYGGTRVTFDLDVCYERSPENLRRLAEALRPFHARLRGVDAVLPFMLDAETLRKGLNFTLTTDFGDIDLLGELQGVGSFNEVVLGCEVQELYGVTCNIASFEVLLRNKKSVARSKDLQDVQELEALKEIKRKRQEDAGIVDARNENLRADD